MQLEWGTVLEQARSNHAQARAKHSWQCVAVMASGMAKLVNWTHGFRMLMALLR